MFCVVRCLWSLHGILSLAQRPVCLRPAYGGTHPAPARFCALAWLMDAAPRAPGSAADRGAVVSARSPLFDNVKFLFMYGIVQWHAGQCGQNVRCYPGKEAILGEGRTALNCLGAGWHEFRAAVTHCQWLWGLCPYLLRLVPTWTLCRSQACQSCSGLPVLLAS